MFFFVSDDALGEPDHGHHGRPGSGHGAALPDPAGAQTLQGQLYVLFCTISTVESIVLYISSSRSMAMSLS